MSGDSIHVVELRSDTFTKPSPKLREAMKNAEVGDSQYNEDPTTNKLQDYAAQLFGKEAALFLPSTTMSNLAAVMSHCYDRGNEVIVGNISHYNMWEQGGICQIAGVYVKQIENLEDGTVDLEKLESLITEDPNDPGCPRTNLICLENTQNYCGGRVLQPEFVEKVANLCKKYDIKLHLDGARIFNAAVALKQDVKTICKPYDSISICCSKGIGAPVGSLLVGSKEFIRRATRARQVLGGALRQSGVLTAAILAGLEDINEKLEKDHVNAKTLAKGFKELSNGLLDVKVDTVETNIFIPRLTDNSIHSKEFIKRMEEVKDDEVAALGSKISVKIGYVSKQTMRIVTHCDVNENDVNLALKKFEYVCREYTKSK